MTHPTLAQIRERLNTTDEARYTNLADARELLRRLDVAIAELNWQRLYHSSVNETLVGRLQRYIEELTK